MQKTKDKSVHPDEKILICDNDVKRLRMLAGVRVERGDNIGALGFLFRALETNEDLDVIIDIADIYADMEMYELSNRFWFLYLSKAPAGKEGVAYEELGVNFFYMDKLYMSGYYFHKKIDVDGFISQDGLDKEIAEYFSEVINNRDAYKIAYPLDRTDYSDCIKEAKRSINIGDYDTAQSLLESVPEGCPQYPEALNELAMLKFILDDVDGGIEIGRKHLEYSGENLCAYANLSSMYYYKHDLDKSRYYYTQALSQPVTDNVEYYKLSTCSLEQGEHAKAITYMEKILNDRPYETNIRYLYGLALINCGKYALASDTFSYLARLVPWDVKIKYYARLALTLNMHGDKNNILPLEYADELPYFEEVRRLAVLKDLPNIERDKINRALKNDDVFDCVLWGLGSDEESVAKLCVLVLSTSTLKKAESALNDLLIDPEVPLHVKEMVLYVSIIYGNKRPMPLVKLNCFSKVKPRKLRFERMPEFEVYLVAYALCFSRLALSTVKNLDKIAFSAERIFKKLSSLVPPDQLKAEDLAALIATGCEYKEIRASNVVKIFGADKVRYKKLKELLES